MDPTEEATYDLISTLVAELDPIFPAEFPFWHMGGDEVQFDCWRLSTGGYIDQFMQDHGIAAGDYSSLQGHFEQRVIDIVQALPSHKRTVSHFPRGNRCVNAGQVAATIARTGALGGKPQPRFRHVGAPEGGCRSALSRGQRQRERAGRNRERRLASLLHNSELVPAPPKVSARLSPFRSRELSAGTLTTGRPSPTARGSTTTR